MRQESEKQDFGNRLSVLPMDIPLNVVSPLERLRNESGETVHVAVLEGADAMYVHRIESQSTLRTFSRVGRRVPAHTTSSAVGTPTGD